MGPFAVFSAARRMTWSALAAAIVISIALAASAQAPPEAASAPEQAQTEAEGVGTLTGRIMGKVDDATSIPIGGVNLRYDMIFGGTFSGTTTTGPQGYYKVKDIPVGSYFLFPSNTGNFIPAPKSAIVVSGQATIVDFLLEPLVPPGPGSIAGKVTNAYSKLPIANASVYYSSSSSREALQAPNADEPSVKTDANGNYATLVPAGTWNVRAEAAGYVASPNELTVVVSNTQTTKNFELTPQASASPQWMNYR